MPHTCPDCGEPCDCGSEECCEGCSGCNADFEIDRDFGDEDDDIEWDEG